MNNYSIIQHLNNYDPGVIDGETHLPHLNILLIGEKGVGKSSLLSTFYRALHQDYGMLPVAGVGNAKTVSFTKKKRGYFLNTSRTIKGYDTRGLESLLREEIEQFKAIRDGRTLDDVEIVQKPYEKWSLWDHLYAIMSRNPAAILDPDCLNGSKKGESSLIDVPHCVIFVVPANQRRVPVELEDFVNLFVEYGYQPLFAVTKIDCHGAEEGDLYAATHLYDCKKEELINTFDLSFDKVKPIQNYTQWDKREVSVENLALDLLSRAVEVAETFVHNWEEKKMRGKSGWSIWRDEICHIM